MKNSEKNTQRIAKNAINALKRTVRKWKNNEENLDFKPFVQIYQNGYVVGMYHSAAAPQNYYVTKKVYGSERGELLFQHFFTNINIDNIKTVTIIFNKNRT